MSREKNTNLDRIRTCKPSLKCSIYRPKIEPLRLEFVSKWYSFQTGPINYIVGFLLLVAHFRCYIQVCLKCGTGNFLIISFQHFEFSSKICDFPFLLVKCNHVETVMLCQVLTCLSGRRYNWLLKRRCIGYVILHYDIVRITLVPLFHTLKFLQKVRSSVSNKVFPSRD